MLKEENKALTIAVEQVIAEAVAIGRGGMLSYPRIAEVCGWDRRHPSWPSLTEKFRRLLLANHQIACETVRGLGFRLMTASDQVVLPAVKRSQRASRQLHRGLKEVSAVDSGSLSVHMQDLRAKQLAGMKQSRQANINAVRQVNALFGDKE